SGIQFHCQIIKRGLDSDRFVGNCLLSLYFKSGSDYRDTLRSFDELRHKDVVSWSSIISGYVRNKMPWNAMEKYVEMLRSGVEPNAFTLSAAIKASSDAIQLKSGESFHGVVVKCGFECNVVIVAAMIDLYGRNLQPDHCRNLFDEMCEPDAVCCTSMISALTRCDLYEEALGVFHMTFRNLGFPPDCYTYGSAATAVGNLERIQQGKQLHARAVIDGFHGNVFVDSSLVDMYAKFGMIEDSRRLFDRMSVKNPVSCCALLGGYCRKDEFEAVIELFADMEKDLYIFGTVLRACSGLAAVKLGKELHCQYLKKGSWRDVVIESALVDLYAKCGCIDFAHRLFSTMPVKNLITWNSMIGGFAQNGRGKEALQIFGLMIEEGVKPDKITFVELLSACSHSGLTDQGRKLFTSMNEDYEIEPEIEHYSCMVDLLGRDGRIEEAADLISSSGFKNEASLWAALLGSCGGGGLRFAEGVATRMMELFPDDHLSYVLLANVYRSNGRWKDSHLIWERMQRRGVKKPPGRS
ncbi:hypothetical protein M569_01655, partial [Genlisea aurea]